MLLAALAKVRIGDVSKSDARAIARAIELLGPARVAQVVTVAGACSSSTAERAELSPWLRQKGRKMQRYFMLDREIGDDEDGFAAALSRAYALREKPLCLCRRDVALPLYISLRHDVHVVARWPGSGALHAPGCEHYEAPDFLTGLGQVKGGAFI